MKELVKQLSDRLKSLRSSASGKPNSKNGVKEKNVSALPSSSPPGAPMAPAKQAAKPESIKIETEHSMAMAGESLVFAGELLTAPNGPLKVPDEARHLCALFDNGLWLVSASHRRSPLVTSVAQAARRMGHQVNEPRYVTPNIIIPPIFTPTVSYLLPISTITAVRRRIVATLEQAV